MAISPRPSTQFVSDLTNFVKAYNTAHGTNYDTRQGLALTDILINGPSKELALLSNDIVYSSEIPSLSFAASLLPSDLDSIGSNFGMTRNPPTHSTGTITLIATVQPTANVIINSGITGSTTATQASNSIQFQLTESIIMSVSNLTPYVVGNTWQITVPIQAVIVGAQGNVAAGTIVNLDQPIQGIQLITNSIATLGGTDEESNIAFAGRIQLALTGNNIGTSNGIIELADLNPLVTGAAVVGPNDPAMLRDEYGGSVDIYIMGSNPISVVENPMYNSSIGYLTLSNTPVLSIVSVLGTVSGNPYPFTLNADVIFVKDLGLLTGSTEETDIVIFPTSTKPDNGTTVQVTLNYDQLIQSLQNAYNLSQNHIISADLLVREATAITINVYAKCGLYSGFTAANVASSIQTAVSTFINSKRLGQSVNASDILDVIDGLPGVNGVDLPSFTPANNVTIGNNQYPIVGTIHGQVGAGTF